MKPEELLPSQAQVTQVLEVHSPTEELPKWQREERKACFPLCRICHIARKRGRFFTFTIFVTDFISVPDFTKPVVVYIFFFKKKFSSIIRIGITMSRFLQKAPFSGVTDSLLKSAGHEGITGKLQNHCLLYLLVSE